MSKMSNLRLIALLTTAFALTACAEVIDAWGPSTRIQANPEVARCTLEGEGLQREVVTPVRVVLPKAASPVMVTCSAEGYRSSTHRLITRIDNSIATNLLFGSSVGVLIDIMSGAAEQYPSRILINLEPAYFANAGARDTWFGRYRISLNSKWRNIVDEMWAICNQDMDTQFGCMEEVANAEAERDREFQALERRRAAAEIRTEAQARTSSDKL